MSNNYLNEKKALLRLYDRISRPARVIFILEFGETLTDRLILDIKSRFEAMIPELPATRFKKPLGTFIVYTGMYLAMYQVLKRQGFGVEWVGNAIWDIGVHISRQAPRIVTKAIGRSRFTDAYLAKLKERASISQLRELPGDYVFRFVEGEGCEFDFGVDYFECASLKFLGQQNARELAPFLCPMDILYSDMFGWGLKRTKTLAQGDAICDFRFRKGKPTEVAIPSSLERHIQALKASQPVD